jgi:hypothetical protein
LDYSLHHANQTLCFILFFIPEDGPRGPKHVVNNIDLFVVPIIWTIAFIIKSTQRDINLKDKGTYGEPSLAVNAYVTLYLHHR